MTPVRQRKSKPGSITQPEADSLLARAVDELGALEAELAPLKPKLARAEALRKALRDRFEGEAPEKACEARGARFIAALGPKAEEWKVQVPQLAKAIGAKAALALAKVTLKAIKGLILPGDVLTSAATGPRPLKLFELGKAA